MRSSESARSFPDDVSISNPWCLTAFIKGSKFVCGGVGWRRSIECSGNSFSIFSATEIFASNMNSSTIEFVSRNCFACTSMGSCVSLSIWKRISGDAKTRALLKRMRKIVEKCWRNLHKIYPFSVLLRFKIFAREFKRRNDIAISSFLFLSSIINWASS